MRHHLPTSPRPSASPLAVQDSTFRLPRHRRLAKLLSGDCRWPPTPPSSSSYLPLTSRSIKGLLFESLVKILEGLKFFPILEIVDGGARVAQVIRPRRRLLERAHPRMLHQGVTRMGIPEGIPHCGKTGQVNYKSSLQQHAQRSAVSLPVYWTVNHGPPHAPKFKSSVTVDGETFSSANVFNNRKEAEQDVSRVALEGIAENLKTKGVPLLQNDTVFCKSILYEYATKTKIEPPKYTSTESKGLLPMFITSVAFDGNTYTGSEGRTKREAEQIAARAVIESIIGSSTGTTMSQIIKSKSRLYDAIHKGNGSCTVHDVGLAGNVENQHAANVAIAKETDSDAAKDKLPDVAIAEPVSSEHPASASVANSFPLEAIKPKEEVCEESELGACVTSPATLQQSEPTLNAPQSVNESQSIGCSNTRKRQNKNKKSRSKRARADGPSPKFPETANEGSPACAEAAAKERRELTAVAV